MLAFNFTVKGNENDPSFYLVGQLFHQLIILVLIIIIIIIIIITTTIIIIIFNTYIWQNSFCIKI